MTQPAHAPSIYTVGGTVQAGGGVYVPRRADDELLAACREAMYAYVLTARQLGKSSLMVRTAERLDAAGVRTAILDLTELGVQTTAQEWYLGLMVRVASRLGISANLLGWWREHAEVGVTQRLSLFFQEIVLPRVEGQIVIFIDEIDSTLSLEFTDDFFAALRYLYNARSTSEALKRLSFVLIGVATPSDLIADPKRTPFNIGRRIDLTDFTAEEAAPFAAGLPGAAAQQAATLADVLAWTGGHPYLTQRLCAELAQRGGGGVDAVVADIFLGDNAQKDNNLQFVADMLTKRAPIGQPVMSTYQQIRLGRRPVRDEEQSLVKSHLKLSGIVKRRGQDLIVRNRIYRTVFDRAWIREQWPVTWWDLIPPPVKVAAAISLVLLIGMVFATAFALDQRDSALRSAEARGTAQADALAQAGAAATARADAVAEADVRATAEVEALAQADARATAQAEAVSSAREAVAAGATAQAEAIVRATAEAIAEEQRLDAERSARVSFARELAANAVNSLEVDPDLSILLALEAVKSTYAADRTAVKQAEEALHQAVALSQALHTLTGPEGEFIGGLAFTPDGRQLAVGHILAGTIALYDAQSGELQSTIDTADDSWVISVAYSGDGSRIVATTFGGRAHVWDAATGAAIGAFDGHTDAVLWASFDATGERVATASWDGTARVWDAVTGEELLRFEHHPESVGVAFSPDGASLALGGDESSVVVVDAATGTERLRLAGCAIANYIAYSADGARLAAHCDASGTAMVWDAVTGAELLVAPDVASATVGANYIAFDPEGRHLATADTDGTVTLWDIDTGLAERSILCTQIAGFVAFSPQGHLIATDLPSTNIVKICSIDPVGETLTVLDHANRINGITYSRDGRRLVTASSDGTARVMDAVSGEPLLVLAADGDELNDIVYSPDETLLATASANGIPRIWDAATGELLHALDGHTDLLWTVEFSPDGSRLASASNDGTARVWDVATGELLLTLSDHDDWVLEVRFSPDGAILVTSSWDTTIKFWDATSGELLLTIPTDDATSGATVWGMTFAPDGATLATGYNTGVLRLWDVAATLATGRGQLAQELPSSSNSITGIAFSRDGARLATSGFDNATRVWDVAAGEELLVIKGHTGIVWDVAFSPDGKSLASASWDGTARVYALEVDDLIELAEERVTRWWTAEECAHFLYSDTCPPRPEP